ncbi:MULTISPECIES: AAA family ATPase [Bacillus]|uniref:AAA family ATPase n=1 Tax=Bacillus TaxID=1386 RepID=UPI00105FE3A5|nr:MULTISPECIES: AAA family ATPase [Bacillus]MBR0615252.1 ATP-binding protein [Bacillus safensis]MBR0636912.1 ATP-binding protein [Bacillus safensis]TDU10237.1 ATPase family protein associated with various cellular activities (AAA) [Bacillus sp. BK450]
MARADLILKLVEAGSLGNMKLFNKTVEAIIAEERSKNHNVLANRLAETLRNKPNNLRNDLKSTVNINQGKLFYETNPEIRLNDLILTPNLSESCNELVEEHFRSDLLRSYNLEPRHRVLLAGPPGNGKTSLAEGIASELMLPLISVRYEGIIDSYLGETSNKLNDLFEYVRTRRCVLFFDEFDTIGKERGDSQETGEIKRVVSSLLLQIDRLPSHVIVIAATNHPELLDRAVWRRFQIKLELNYPTRKQINDWLDKFELEFGTPLEYTRKTLLSNLSGMSFSNLNDFGLDIRRKYVLSLPSNNMKKIVKDTLNKVRKQYVHSDLRGENNDDGKTIIDAFDSDYS